MAHLRRRMVDYAMAAFLLLLPAVVLWSSLKDPENLNGFDKAVLRLTSPLQAVASWTVEGIGGVWNDYVWLVDVEEENDELRAENQRLRRELAEARRRDADMATLEELVDLKRRTAAETVGARVVSSSVSPHFRVERIRIDRGEADVEIGMPVINADGLVGRVHRSYGDYADVLLVSDPQSSIDVVVPRTGGRGVLTGLATDDGYLCKIEYLEHSAEVDVDDVVVTSGLGNAFPAGLVVGRIAEIDSAKYGLYQKVRVKPAVDFSRLGTLLVLLAPPPPEDPEPDREEPSRLAHGVRPL